MTYASEVLADNPIRYYHLEETSGNPDDSSASNIDGQYINALTLGVTGVVGLAARNVAANSTYINMPISGLTTAVSIEFWWKSGGTAAPVIWRDQTGAAGWLMLLTGTADADLTVRLNNNNRTVSGAGTTLDDGSFHHVVLTSSGTAAVLYIDGASVDSWSVTAAASTIATAIRWGRNGTVNTTGYAGDFDELAVYPTVLSATRVGVHYVAATSKTGTTTGGYAWAGTAVGVAPEEAPGTPAATFDLFPTSIHMYWFAPIDGGEVTGYKVAWYDPPGIYGTPVDVGTDLDYLITGLTPDTGYQMKVWAYGPGGEGDPDETLLSTTSADLVRELATSDPLVISSGGSWIPVKVLT